MKTLLSLFVALVAAAALSGLALAGGWTSSKNVHLTADRPSASFSLQVSQPQKLVLFINAAKVSATTKCTKGTKVTTKSRSFDTDGTRNLLWKVPRREDSCDVSVSASRRSDQNGYVAVDAKQR